MEEKGLGLIAVEADWPDAYRVNRWVHALSNDADAEESLSGFGRVRSGWGATPTSSTCSGRGNPNAIYDA